MKSKTSITAANYIHIHFTSSAVTILKKLFKYNCLFLSDVSLQSFHHAKDAKKLYIAYDSADIITTSI